MRITAADFVVAEPDLSTRRPIHGVSPRRGIMWETVSPSLIVPRGNWI